MMIWKTRDLDGRCTVASASPALGRGKAVINLWVHDYSIGKATLTSQDSRSSLHMLKRIFMLLIHFGALAVIICFVITNYSVSRCLTRQQLTDIPIGHGGDMVNRPRPAYEPDADADVNFFGQQCSPKCGIQRSARNPRGTGQKERHLDAT